MVKVDGIDLIEQCFLRRWRGSLESCNACKVRLLRLLGPQLFRNSSVRRRVHDPYGNIYFTLPQPLAVTAIKDNYNLGWRRIMHENKVARLIVANRPKLALLFRLLE